MTKTIRMRITFLTAILLAGLTANADEPEDLSQRVLAFESSLFVDHAKKQYEQRPEEEQRPMVEAFFATLKTSPEKLAFLGVGDSRYVYAINRDVYGEYAARLLKDADARVRVEAVQGLTYNLLKKYDVEVARLLDDVDTGVRGQAVVTVSRFGRHDLLPRMKEMAGSAKGEEERVAGLAAVGVLLHDKEGAAEQRERELALAATYLEPDAAPAMQVTALDALATVPEAAKYTAKLVKLAGSMNDNVRARAIKTLTPVEGPAAVAAIRQGLTDATPNVRRVCVVALGIRKTIEAAGDVAKLLDDKDDNVRGGAVSSLAAMNAAAYADAIARRLTDSSLFVRRPAINALAALKSAKHAGQIAATLTDPDMELRVNALRALVDMGTREQAPAIAAVAHDDSYPVRLWVLRAFAAIDARDQWTVVESLTHDSEKEVAREASEVLKKWDAK